MLLMFFLKVTMILWKHNTGFKRNKVKIDVDDLKRYLCSKNLL